MPAFKPGPNGKLLPGIQMEVRDGTLHIGKVVMRARVVRCVEEAVCGLLAGEQVIVQEYGKLPDEVIRAIEAMIVDENCDGNSDGNSDAE